MVKCRKLQSIKGQAGQAITEAILLMVVFFGITLMVSQYFVDQEVLASLVKRPWQTLSGVVQNGVWETPERGIARHPNTHIRHISNEGERAR